MSRCHTHTHTQGIKGHTYQNVFADIGQADLSALVDFYALRTIATKEQGIVVSGPVTQGEFLKALGIQARLATLIRSENDDQRAEMLGVAYRRLTSVEQMGRIYKAMAFSTLPQDSMPAPGFEMA
jgi:NADH dehydrogenase [ubiquinone] 1 alpha subcomplex assembly factor 7